MKNLLYVLFFVLVFTACSNSVKNVTFVNKLPKIYPDYAGVTIPVGIAPLNFNWMGGDFDCMDVVVKGSKSGEIHTNGDLAEFDIDDWHKLVSRNKGGRLVFTVCVEKEGKWIQYKDFTMYVSTYPLDEYGLTYRRIAPGYEVYSKMGLYQRDLGNFDESAIIENTQVPGMCINCHTSNRTDPKEFLFHVRGDHGATVIQIDGTQEVLNTKTDKTLGLCVYPYWHPKGRYIAFSTNTTRQAFHEVKDERIEVFDFDSDLQVYDTQTHSLILSPLLKTTDYNETFPVFSADGKTMYFTTSKKREYPKDAKIVRYNLCKISFDASTGRFGNKVDTIINAEKQSKSIAFPRPSFNGKYIMYTLVNYGTFPIWHREADLYLLDLKTKQSRKLDEVNSSNTESFHNWNTNSHWFVFSSRRDDGLYTRLYLASIDDYGKVSKPFLLPQENPWKYYDRSLYSFNVPDFTKTKVKLDAQETGREIMSKKRTNISVK